MPIPKVTSDGYFPCLECGGPETCKDEGICLINRLRSKLDEAWEKDKEPKLEY